MKNIQKAFYVALLFAIISCGSDNLSNSKAADIIEDCLEKEPLKRTARITIGKATFTKEDYDAELLSKYKKLKEEGYIEMELIKEITKGWRKGTKEYKIKLAEKGLEYMDEIPEKGSVASAKAFNYEVDEVLEVQEIPAENTAIVKVKFKAENITPFAILSLKDPKEFWIKDVRMTKTSNGWKYCDNF